jgi:hypothetical protein
LKRIEHCGFARLVSRTATRSFLERGCPASSNLPHRPEGHIPFKVAQHGVAIFTAIGLVTAFSPINHPQILLPPLLTVAGLHQISYQQLER